MGNSTVCTGRRTSRKARLPSSNCQIQALHINKVLKMYIPHPSNFFINWAIKERGEKNYYIGPLVCLSIIKLDVVICSKFHFFLIFAVFFMTQERSWIFDYIWGLIVTLQWASLAWNIWCITQLHEMYNFACDNPDAFKIFCCFPIRNSLETVERLISTTYVPKVFATWQKQSLMPY